jgi:hypothetical protein
MPLFSALKNQRIAGSLVPGFLERLPTKHRREREKCLPSRRATTNFPEFYEEAFRSRMATMPHLSKHADSTREGTLWKCSECGWESLPMYFGEVFEPEHLCPNEYCECGHRRLEHKNNMCTGATIREQDRNINHTQELCSCKTFHPK